MPCNRKKQKELKRLRNEPPVVVEPVVEEKIEEVIVEPVFDLDEPIVETVDIFNDPIIETVIEKTEDELKALNKSELITLAEQLGINTKGTKAELIARILGE
jgi:hypothetical protein